MESNNVSEDNNSPPHRITMQSIVKIKMPTLIPVLSWRNWAMRSVPPVLVLNFNIKPMPNPTRSPPKTELNAGSTRISELMGLKRSMKKEETIIPCKLL